MRLPTFAAAAGGSNQLCELKVNHPVGNRWENGDSARTADQPAHSLIGDSSAEFSA
jgi:hypothetical protein